MNFFKLHKQQHEDFLKEGRHDPVTGDGFSAGEEVTFCAACGSAFHRSSWEYLGGKHCGQQATLPRFPKAHRELSFAWRPGEQLFPVDTGVSADSPKPREWAEWGGGIFLGIISHVLVLSSLLGLGFFIPGYGITNLVALVVLYKFKDQASSFSLRENVLQYRTPLKFWNWRYKFKFKDVEKLRYEHHDAAPRTRPRLVIQLKSGKKQKVKLPASTHAERQQFLYALGTLSHRLPIEVASVRYEDEAILQELNAQGMANIAFEKLPS